MFEKLKPNAALVEMMAAENDAKPFGVRGEMLPANPQIFAPVTMGWKPPPPDWEAERIEREQLERERQREERAKILEQELERLAGEDQQTYPAPAAVSKRKRWH